MSRTIRDHLEDLLALSHFDWWELPRQIRRDVERDNLPVPEEFQVPEEEDPADIPDPHRPLADLLEAQENAGTIAEWESWLDPREPWLQDAILRTDALPQEEEGGGRACAHGAYRLRMAVPFTLLRMKSPGPALAQRVLRLGICEENPSDNKYFIEPAIRILGMERVLEGYLEAFGSGRDEVRGGVANALYWTRYDAGGIPGPGRPDDSEDRIRGLQTRLATGFIDAFLAADESRNLHFMQTTLSMLGWLTAWVPEGRAKVQKCIEKAGSCRDPYIRSRMEPHPPKGKAPPLLMAKPHRPKAGPSDPPWWKLW